MTTKYQPGVRVSEYVLEQCVGAGTFGEVWQARHHVWENERVAVKLPTEPEYVRYLQREGVVVHGLQHPNIVRVLGLDPYADPPYLVMELVKGPSLRQVIADHPQGMPVDVALLVLRGVLRGLTAAHAAQIVHRDLKPGNVLLRLDDRPLAALALDDVKIGDHASHFYVAADDRLATFLLKKSPFSESEIVALDQYVAAIDDPQDQGSNAVVAAILVGGAVSVERASADDGDVYVFNDVVSHVLSRRCMGIESRLFGFIGRLLVRHIASP